MLERLKEIRKSFARSIWNTVENPPYGGERIVFAYSGGVFSDMNVEDISISANGKEIYQFSELVNEIEKYTDNVTQKSEAIFMLKDYFELICEDFISKTSLMDLYLFKDNTPYVLEDISMYQWLIFVEKMIAQNHPEIAGKAFVCPLHSNQIDERWNTDNFISCAKYMLRIGQKLNWAESEITQHIASQFEKHISSEEKDLKLSTWIKENINEVNWKHFNYLKTLKIVDDESYAEDENNANIYLITIDGYKLQGSLINKTINAPIPGVQELIKAVVDNFNQSEALKELGMNHIHLTHTSPDMKSNMYEKSHLYCNVQSDSILTQQEMKKLVNDCVKEIPRAPITSLMGGYTEKVLEEIKNHIQKWTRSAFLAYKLEHQLIHNENGNESDKVTLPKPGKI